MTRFLGRMYGYYPANALQAYKVDYIVDCYLDVISKFYMGLFTQDEDARPKIIDDLFNIHLPKIMKLA